MNGPRYNRLLEQSWRRKLTAAEEAELRAWLAAHPEAQSDWEAEAGLNEALGRLADAPMPTNFTARVLQAVELEGATEPRGRAWAWQSWRFFLPKAAAAAVVLGAGLLAYHQHEVTKRMELAQCVAAVSEVAALPSPDALQDFEAIRRLNPTAPADEELLTLMQ
jgi:anti-sigma factor RsiW